MESIIPLLLIFAVMMLPLLWMSSRQRKAQQKQLELVRQLGVGDEVRTHSGFYGLIVEEYEDIVVLESEDGSQTKWARQAIAMSVDPTPEEELAEDGTPAAPGETVESAEPRDEATADSTASDEVPGVTARDEDADARRER